MMSSDTTYNGWTNRETWLVNLWFNPETKSDLTMARVVLEDAYDACPDFIKDFIDLHSINWEELTNSLEEDEEDVEDD